MNRKLSIGAMILLASIALSGCTFNFGSDGSNNGSGMMGNQGGDSEFSASDIMFAQMMIPHHQQAVDLGTLAETRAFSPEVKELAAQIKAEQSPEINQMKSWLESANAPMTMDHDMGMDGMLSDSEMQELENSSGAEFDQLFLKAMIAHHQGAIEMAQMVTGSNNAEAQALGKAIIDSQTEQIKYMESLLDK